MRYSFTRLIALAALLIAGTMMSAQEVASVTGTVTDKTGAVIPGVNVALVNTRTNTSYQAVSSGSGVYSITKVLPGPGYKLTFKKDGFESVVINDLYLTVSVTRTQDAQMAIGKITESVEVSAAGEGVALNTTDATVGNNFNMTEIAQLPIQVRDSPAALMTLQPGVINGTGGSDSLGSRAGAVTGARGDQNNITLDGLDVNDFATGQAFATVANAPVDSIQEFRGETAGSLSTAGRGSGAQISLVTKSGTNNFHGSAYDYHRNTALTANTWFNNNRTTPIPTPTLIRNQFGAAIGGPVIKDKRFFFFNYNGRRQAQSVSALTTVPLDSFRAGNVSYIKATDAGGATCLATSRQNTTPGCIGTLTPAQAAAIDPQGIGPDAALLSFINSRYPHANDLTVGDGINTGGFRFNSPVHRSINDYVSRVDYNLNSNMKLFGRFSIQRDNQDDAVNFTAPARFPGDPITHAILNKSYAYVIGHTWTVSPTVVNQFTYGKTVSDLSFPTLFNPVGTNSWTFGGGNVTFLTNPYFSQASQARRIPIPVFRDDLTWQKGNHQIQMGGFFKPIKSDNQLVGDNNFPTLGLGGNTLSLNSTLRPSDIRTAGTTASSTYDSAFALILGRIGQVKSNYNYDGNLNVLPQGSGADRQYRYWETEAYIQDQWKATKALTLTFGVRYQYYSVPYEVNGIEAIPNIGFDELINKRVALGQTGTSGDTVVPITSYDLAGKANNAPGLYEANYKNFAPRVAFAYSPTSDSWLKRVFGEHNFVIRGGGGIVYDHPVTNALNFIQDQNSYMFQSSSSAIFGDGTNARNSLLNDPRFTGINNIPTPAPAPTVTRPFTPFVEAGVPVGIANGEFNYAIDQHLKTPYSILLTLGFQRELPGHFVFETNYVGRLGRRLIAQADASQLIDFKDPASGQMMSTAFGTMSTLARDPANYDASGSYAGPAVPWFENQSFPGATGVIVDAVNSLVTAGDFADTIQILAANGLLANNVGMAAQFASNTYITNKASSNYHGLLTSLHRNFANGLQFDFNYTYSHSIDNASGIANSISASSGLGFICDATNARLCRGNSDFDVKHIITSNFVYELPFGRGKSFGSGVNGALNQLIGGWSVSGIPVWRSGIAYTTVTDAFIMGFANNAPAIFNGDRGAVAINVHKTSDGTLNIFADPDKAQAAFSYPTGFNIGSRNNLRGPSYFNLDFGAAKKFPINERFNVQFRADAFNIFNHPSFGLPGGGGGGTGADLQSASRFGQITSTANDPRTLQLALRVEF